jgi:hypothetical protein
VTKDELNALVDRFLAWPLPESVCADLCATEQGYPHRIGTNLLSAEEARQMLEYLLTAPSAPASEGEVYEVRSTFGGTGPMCVYLPLTFRPGDRVRVTPLREGEA